MVLRCFYSDKARRTKVKFEQRNLGVESWQVVRSRLACQTDGAQQEPIVNEMMVQRRMCSDVGIFFPWTSRLR